MLGEECCLESGSRVMLEITRVYRECRNQQKIADNDLCAKQK